jgi:hypothetical protein
MWEPRILTDFVEDGVQTWAVDTVVNFRFHEVTEFVDYLNAVKYSWKGEVRILLLRCRHF